MGATIQDGGKRERSVECTTLIFWGKLLVIWIYFDKKTHDAVIKKEDKINVFVIKNVFY